MRADLGLPSWDDCPLQCFFPFLSLLLDTLLGVSKKGIRGPGQSPVLRYPESPMPAIFV